jgi:hypothetical protein
MFLQNVSSCTDYTALYPWRWHSNSNPTQKPHVLAQREYSLQGGVCSNLLPVFIFLHLLLKIKVNLCYLYPVFVCLRIRPLSAFEFLNQYLLNLVFITRHIVLQSNVLHKHLSSVFFSMCTRLSLLGNSSRDTFPSQRINSTIEEFVWDVVCSAAHASSKEGLWASLCIKISLLGNGTINGFQRQRRIVGGIFFYEFGVV